MRNLMLVGTAAMAIFALSAPAQEAIHKANAPKIDRQVETHVEEVKATTTYVFDRNLGPGRVLKTGSGTSGKKTITTVRQYIHGKLVKETTKVALTTKPDNIVYRMGPAGYTKVSRSGSYVPAKVLTVSASAYMANEGSMNPTSNTATGRKCEFGIVAVDPHVIPLNSFMFVEGYGLGIAADTGGKIRGKKIDLCMDSRSQMNDWGRRTVTVHVLRTLTDKELSDMGVKEGTEVKIHDDLLAKEITETDVAGGTQSLQTTQLSALAIAPPIPQAQDDPNDPASTPGRDPNEAPISGIHAPDVPPVKVPYKPETTTKKTDTTPKTTDAGPTVPAGFRRIRVEKDAVNVRSKASTDSPIVSMLLKDDAVMVGAAENGWVPVVTTTGGTGWVRADLLGLAPAPAPASKSTATKPVEPDTEVEKPTKTATKPTVVKRKKDADAEPQTRTKTKEKPESEPTSGRSVDEEIVVRTGPDTSKPKYTTLGKGEKVKIVGEKDGWYKVKLSDGSIGYVRHDKLNTATKKAKPESKTESKKTKAKNSKSEESSSKKTTKKKKKAE